MDSGAAAGTAYALNAAWKAGAERQLREMLVGLDTLGLAALVAFGPRRSFPTPATDSRPRRA